MSATMILIIPCWESFRAPFCISTPAPHTLSSSVACPVSQSQILGWPFPLPGTLSSSQPSTASFCMVLCWDVAVSLRPPPLPTYLSELNCVFLLFISFLLFSSLSFSGLPLSSRPLSSSSAAFRLCPERFLQLAAVSYRSHAQSLCKTRTQWKLRFQASLDPMLSGPGLKTQFW